MPHDVFVSHSTKDKIAADAVVAHLERAGIKCWSAPRDIEPGASWAKSIVDAINQCKAMVVVFSTHANQSDHVRREIERAVNHGAMVVPVRIENVLPQGDLEYFLSSSHWMDAITPPVERHFDELAKKLHRLIVTPPPPGGAPPTTVADIPATARVDDRGPGSTFAQTGRAFARALWTRLRPRLHEARAAILHRPRVAAGIFGALILLTIVLVIASHKGGPPKEMVGPKPDSVLKSATAAVSSADAAPVASAAHLEDAELKSDFDGYVSQILRGSSVPFFESRAPIRYRSWQRGAERGDAVAQVFVGRCLYEGISVPADKTESVKWMQKSARPRK